MHTHIHTHSGMHIKHTLLISFTFPGDFGSPFAADAKIFPLRWAANFKTKEEVVMTS